MQLRVRTVWMGRVLVVAAVAALPVAAAACATERTGRPPGEPEEVVRAAPGRTLAAGTARLSVVSQDSFVDGTVDLATGRGEVRLRSQAVPERDGRALRVDYLTAYLKGVAASVDATAVSAAPAQLLGGGLQPGNPLAVLDLLLGAVEVTSYGGAAIRGDSTFRYQLLINPDRVLAEAAADRRPALTRVLQNLRGTPLPGDVWVDVEGRVRRVQFGNDLTQATTTTDRRGFPFATTVDLYEYGAAPTKEP